MGGLSVKVINTIQVGDLNVLSDDIYFRGCSKQCKYCFNPELRDSIGNNMTVKDIINNLSFAEWVCLMGGEPMEQDLLELKKLVDTLHGIGKKVCVFTSYPDPWKYITADHYHIHINQTSLNEKVPKNVSLGLVSYNLTEDIMTDKLACVNRDIPIYVKTCYGYEDLSNVESNALYLSTVLGFNNIVIDGVIDTNKDYMKIHRGALYYEPV